MSVAKVSKVEKSKGIEYADGTYVGLFLGLVHLGVQRGEYKGVVSYKDQILLYFELQDVVLPDGRPIILTKRENHILSAGKGKESNLLKFGRALAGGKDVDGINWEESIGKPIMLRIEANDKGYKNIKDYMAVPDSFKKTLKPLINEPKLLLDVDTIGDKELEKLHESVRKIINQRVKEESEADSSVDF